MQGLSGPTHYLSIYPSFQDYGEGNRGPCFMEGSPLFEKLCLAQVHFKVKKEPLEGKAGGAFEVAHHQ